MWYKQLLGRASVIKMRLSFLEQRECPKKAVFYALDPRNADNFPNYAGSSELEGRVDISDLIRTKEEKGQLYCSFELVSRKGDEDIYQRFFEAERDFSPLFYALTCHVKSFLEPILPLQLLPNFPKNTLLHLSCRGMKFEDAERILEEVFNLGITNLFVIRGDNPIKDGDFMYAVDLIEFIKTRYGSKFCIGVAGYPDIHPESPSRESDLQYLKKKVDAGASFVISQIVFDSQSFIKFVEDCRKIGIDVPIIPGIFPIINYKSLINLEKICGLRVPEDVHKDLQGIKDENEKIEEYGVNLATRITKEIIDSGIVHGFHLFTLNKISAAHRIVSAVASPSIFP